MTTISASAVLRILCVATLGMIVGSARAQAPGFDFSFGDTQEEEFGDSRDRAKITSAFSQNAILPGGDVVLAIKLSIDFKWHIWPAPGENGSYSQFDDAIRTTLSLANDEPGPVTPHLGFVTWPKLHGAEADVGEGKQEYGVYEGEAVILIPVTVSADAKPGEYSVDIDVNFQACDDRNCMNPATFTSQTTLNVIASGSTEARIPLADEVSKDFKFSTFDPTVFAKIRSGEKGPQLVEFDVFGFAFSVNASDGTGFLLLLLVAAIGGFLLNLTPCVLPVIPLKIMGLSSAAGNRFRCFMLGFSMSVGVVAFWMVLGGLIAGIKSFEAISQLFQYPLFTISVGVVITVMGIGMAGFFTIRLPNKVYGIQTGHDTIVGSFLFGIMTAVLSTPCTAPLMGAAAAWAITQSPGTVLMVFASIGTGMALPYLVLSAFPVLVEKMPRTGAASELVKQVMGLLLLAAGIYFMGSGLSGILVTAPDPPNKLYWWAVAAAGISAGGWMLVRTPLLTKKYGPRIVFCGLGALIVYFSGYIGYSMTAKGPINWVYYTPERFAAAVDDERVIMLDFTAEWCLNCKTLESTSLAADAVVSLVKRDDVVPMKIDLTGNNPDGRAMLTQANRVTIPLLIVFGKDGTAVFKSDAYTGTQVANAIKDAAETLGISITSE